MLFNKLDRIKRTSIMTTIVLLFTGLFCMTVPNDYLALFGSIVGFLLCVAFFNILFDYLSSSKALINYIFLTIGLFLALIGVLFMTTEWVFANVLTAVVGDLPFLMGVYSLIQAFVFARRSGKDSWKILALLGVAMILAALFVFFDPFSEGYDANMQVLGGSLMFASLMNICRLIVMERPNKVRKSEEN